MDLSPQVIVRPHLRPLEADGAAPGHGVQHHLPGLEVGHHHEAGADGGAQGARAELGDCPVIEGGVGQGEAAVHLDLTVTKFHFENTKLNINLSKST